MKHTPPSPYRDVPFFDTLDAIRWSTRHLFLSVSINPFTLYSIGEARAAATALCLFMSLLYIYIDWSQANREKLAQYTKDGRKSVQKNRIVWYLTNNMTNEGETISRIFSSWSYCLKNKKNIEGLDRYPLGVYYFLRQIPLRGICRLALYCFIGSLISGYQNRKEKKAKKKQQMQEKLQISVCRS